MITVRQAAPSDGAALLTLHAKLDSETTFMMMEPGERTSTPEQEAERLRIAVEQGNPLILVAETEGKLVGYLDLEVGEPRRVRHTG